MPAIENRARFDFIRYANCWEDPLLLIKSLKPSPGDRVLSIASAGDNSLSLLSTSPDEVVAIDLNPSQIASSEIRILAIKNLKREEVLQLLGYRDSNDRLKLYQLIRPELSTESARFWDNYPEVIEKGLIHAGKFEKYLTAFGKKILPFLQGNDRIRELIQVKSIAEQREFYNKKWNHTGWRLFFKFFFSRPVMGLFGRDPEFFREVEGSVAQRILYRTEHALTELSTSANPFLEYILTGEFRNNLPHYLLEDVFPKVKENITRIRLVTGPIESLIDSGTKFSCFNLSDIFEYMDKDYFQKLALVLNNLGDKNARFAYWNMLVLRDLQNTEPGLFRTRYEMSNDLLRSDRAWFYSKFFISDKVAGE